MTLNFTSLQSNEKYIFCSLFRQFLRKIYFVIRYFDNFVRNEGKIYLLLIILITNGTRSNLSSKLSLPMTV